MKENKKIVIAVALIIVILGAMYFINKGAKPTAATSTQAKSATEQKLITILSSMDGVGTTDVMVNEREGEITGVVIVCRGADNIMTRNNILNAVSTALNIDKKIIAIYSMEI